MSWFSRTFAKWNPPFEPEIEVSVGIEERLVDPSLVQLRWPAAPPEVLQRIEELERVVQELELVILELLPAPFRRSEHMVEFERKRRSSK